MVNEIRSKSNEINTYSVNKKDASKSKGSIDDSNFMDYINNQYKNYEKAKTKSVNSTSSSINNLEKENYSQLLNDLDKNIKTLKDDYENLNRASNISDKASANKKINDDLKKLNSTLNKVENVVKKDKLISKNDLNEMKKLMDTIPKDALKNADINNKKMDIDNCISNDINSSISELEDSIKDICELDDVKQDDSITNEQVLQMLQNVLDLINNNESINNSENLSNIKDELQQLIGNISNSNFNIEDIKEMSSDINDILQMLEQINSSEDLSEVTNLLKELESNLNNKIEDNFKTKSEIITELQKFNIESNNNKNDIHKFVQGTNEEAEEVSNTENVSNCNTENSNNNASSNNTEEKILNSIINDNNNNNIINRFQTANTFEATLNNVKVQEPVINESSMASDIVSSIRYMNVKGLEELTVKLNPRELGQVVINIVKEGDAMKAQIKASSRETYALLMKNSEDIKKYLGEQNLKVQDVEIKFTNDTSYSKNETFFGQESKNSNNQEKNSKINNINEEDYSEVEDDEENELLSNINMLV